MTPMYLWITLIALSGGFRSQSSLHQVAGSDDLISSHQEQREYCTLLVRSQIQLSLATPRPHRAQHTELNVHRRVTASQ